MGCKIMFEVFHLTSHSHQVAVMGSNSTSLLAFLCNCSENVGITLVGGNNYFFGMVWQEFLEFS